MVVTKRSMPSRNDILFHGPEPILDGSLQAAKRREAIFRFWHLADMETALENVCFRRQSGHP
jgi:hypothetical protein